MYRNCKACSQFDLSGLLGQLLENSGQQPGILNNKPWNVSCKIQQLLSDTCSDCSPSGCKSMLFNDWYKKK